MYSHRLSGNGKKQKDMKKLLIALMLVVGFGTISKSQIPCVVIEWNTDSTAYTVVNYNYNPLFLPVIGLEEHLEILVKRAPYQIPDYDPRLKLLLVSHGISETYDAQYPTTRMWLETYDLIGRSVSEKIISVSEAEAWANYQVFPTTKHLKYIALTLAILDKKASGLSLSVKEQAILDKVNAKALSIWQNHINASAMIDTLNAGGSVDLDLNWNETDPENE